MRKEEEEKKPCINTQTRSIRWLGCQPQTYFLRFLSVVEEGEKGARKSVAGWERERESRRPSLPTVGVCVAVEKKKK